MTNFRKYAGLPDLDIAPDIYETPELTDDTSTRPTSTTLRSESRASSGQGSADDESSYIVRQRLDPDEARTHFLPAKVDAENVDFSDRIDGKRKSYRTSSRRKRYAAQQGQGLGDFSGEDDDATVEGLERRIARLHRETEETKNEISRRRDAHKNNQGSDVDQNVDEHALNLLGNTLDELNILNVQQTSGAETRLLRKMRTAPESVLEHKAKAASEEKQQLTGESSYTVTYGPNFLLDHTLAKVADFETRLTILETILGIESIPLPTQGKGSNRAILPALDELDKQISTLSSTSPSALDAVSKRIRQLIQDAEKLDEARKSAKASQDALGSSQGGINPSSLRDPGSQDGKIHEELEQTSKINALFGTLATIESLAPLLPSVLDRLRSLRLVHADAATAGQNLASIEKRQAEMAEDIKAWKEGLEKVEAAIRGGEVRMTENTKSVEGWVSELQKRLSDLGM